MSQSFPLSLQLVINLLRVIAPEQPHVLRVAEFLQTKLPKGFPVHIDIPVFPTVKAAVTFIDFKRGVPDNLLEIPSDYQEDPRRFKNLADLVAAETG